MQTIPLKPVPSQSFSLTLDGNLWDVTIKLTRGVMSCSFTLNGQPILSNILAVAGYRLIPYDYLQNGNFAFITMNSEIPDYQKFGTTQQLVYISPAELAALVKPFQGAKVTVADFDPNGALPLRFKPQGYIKV